MGPLPRRLIWIKEVALPFQGDECLAWPFKPAFNGYGPKIMLDGIPHSAHRVVCILTHGEPPFKGAHAAHSCGLGSKGCMNPRHLSWKSQTENNHDRKLHGTASRGTKAWNAKLTDNKVLEIRASKETYRNLSKNFGVSSSVISGVKNRTTWAHVADQQGI